MTPRSRHLTIRPYIEPTMKTKALDETTRALKDRFERNTQRHEGIAWRDVEARLAGNGDALKALVAEKRKKGKITEAEEEEGPRPKGDNVIDLMDVLRKSLKDVQGTRGKTSKLGARKPPQRVTQPTSRGKKEVKR